MRLDFCSLPYSQSIPHASVLSQFAPTQPSHIVPLYTRNQYSFSSCMKGRAARRVPMEVIQTLTLSGKNQSGFTKIKCWILWFLKPFA